MIGMEQEPPFGANEAETIIDLRGAQSDDEALVDSNYLAHYEPEDPLFKLYESQVMTTATVLSLGIMARESRTAYAIRQEVPGVFWAETQRSMLDLMKHVRGSGHEANVGINMDDDEYMPFLAVYNSLYDYSEHGEHEEFINFLDGFLSKQNKFVDDPKQLGFDDYAYVLRPFTTFLRTASESYFLHKFGKSYLETDILVPPTLVNHALLREFTNSAYWRSVHNEMLNDIGRDADMDSSARQGVIGMYESLGRVSLDISESDDEYPSHSVNTTQ